MLKEVEGFIPFRLYSANYMRRLHWRERGRIKRDAQLAIRQALGVPRPFPGKVRLTVSRCMGYRERPYDTDNLFGGSAKEVIDGLKNLGWFKDDSPQWLEVHMSQIILPDKKMGALIRMEDLEGK